MTMNVSKEQIVNALAALDEDTLNDLLDNMWEKRDELAEEQEKNKLDLKAIEEKRAALLDAAIEYLKVNPIASTMGFPHRPIEKEKEELEKSLLEVEGLFAGALLQDKMPCIAKELMKEIKERSPKDEELRDIVRRLIN